MTGVSASIGCLVALLLIATGCSLVAPSDEELKGGGGAAADASADTGGDGGPCAAGSKRCDDQCVGFDNPAFGCAADGCDPCPAPAHATATCVNGSCVAGDCESTRWFDCNSDIQDGCETDLWTIENCGACGVGCSRMNADAVCTDGVCGIGQCLDGFADCNDVGNDGCETNLRTLSNCGGCGVECSVPNGVPDCSTGTCKPGICTNPLTADCNDDPGDGCETDLTTLENCGACGTTCARTNAEVTCDTGTCAILQCIDPFGDCNTLESDGCETNTDGAPEHCGGCSAPCSINHVPFRTCTGGSCTGLCESGWSDCNTNKRTDGCEAPTGSDANNCGICGAVCSSNHIPTPTCVGGICSGACESGWDDCDFDKFTNGCEAELDVDVNHCGACRRACDGFNVTPGGLSCAGGLCDTTQCEGGWTNVSQPPQPAFDDGCETPP